MAFSVSNSSPRFPEQLRSCVKTGQNMQQRDGLLSEVLVDKVTREKFQAWAERHEKFVESSPMMRQIAAKVSEYDALETHDGGISLFINTFIKPLFSSKKKQEETEIVCNQIESATFNLDLQTLNPHSALIGEYAAIGTIPEDQIRQLFSTQDKAGHTLLQSPDALQSVIPLLEKLETGQWNQSWNLTATQRNLELTRNSGCISCK
jgi:hypothetical protein